MIKHSLRSIGLLAILILLTSGGNVTVKVMSKPASKIDKIALISTYLNFTEEFGFSAYRAQLHKKTDLISKELNDMLEKKADILRDSIAVSLSHALNCQVLYGDNLHNIPGYNFLKEKYNFNSVLTKKEDEFFPVVWQSSNDNNFFEFTKVNCDKWGDGIPIHFNKSSRYKEQIIDICKNLNVNYVCLSYSNILTIAGGLAEPNKIASKTFFFLFDKEGEYIAFGSNFNTPVILEAAEIQGYEEAFKIIPSLFTPIFEKMITKF